MTLLSFQVLPMYFSYTFLDARDIAPERRRIMMPDDQILPIDTVPDWYWHRAERIMGHVQDFLRGDVSVFTYFTCEEEPDGTLFHTVCALPDSAEWTVISTSKTVLEALEQHATIRAAWWQGPEYQRYAKAPELPPLRVRLPGFEVPIHPLDVLD
ncbi:hypothetical protein MF271_24400 (plasmid) [Deinococcus sp. KNUC1210]|uniref:hypothetical protein n=1 Tax=Deinococcus sp. KNUC1210 TaxID=2917691 RepID=UPI001EEFF5C4|nr:hypothetical protein [Deinococcus sp. KNUC1210]ULH18099.1 hypothetical protein MF271_24400 [Deinococcus sp. KNUC1210]